MNIEKDYMAEAIASAQTPHYSGRLRYEIVEHGPESDDYGYVTIKVRKGTLRKFVNAAYVGVSAKHQEGSPFPRTTCGMIWDLRKRTSEFFTKNKSDLNDETTLNTEP